MPAAWKTPLTWFVLFNLLAAPFVGRAVWFVMQQLNADDARLAAVALSLAAALGILGVNSLLTVQAARAGMPGPGRKAMWAVTGLTFALTVGFGFFSPVNLAIGMLRAAAM